MTNNNLTDAEIKKANKVKEDLEEHYINKGDRVLIKQTFDVIECYEAEINRLQAENERLENTIIALMNYLDILGVDKTDTSFVKEATEFNKQIRADIKAEAYKEFANELKCRTHEISCNTLQVVTEYDIDNLLNELVGDANETR